MEHRTKRDQLQMLESHKPLRNPVPLLNTRFPLIKNKGNTLLIKAPQSFLWISHRNKSVKQNSDNVIKSRTVKKYTKFTKELYK